MPVIELLLIGGGFSLAVFLIVDHVIETLGGRSCLYEEDRKMKDWHKWEQGIYYGVVVALLVFNVWWVIGELT